MVIQPITVNQIQIPIDRCLDSQMLLNNARSFYSNGAPFLPVLSNDKIIGILPLKKILEVFDTDKTLRTADVTSDDFRIVAPDVPFAEIVINNFSKHVIVSTNGKISGILYLDDALIHLYEAFLDIQNNLYEIIDSVDDGIGIADNEGKIVLLNDSYVRLTGMSKKEAGLGKHVTEVIKEGVISRSISLEVMKYRTTRTIIQKIKTGCEVLATGRPTFDKDGNIKRVICNFRDLSYLNRVRSQLGLTKSNNELMEKMNVKTPAMAKVIELVSRVAPVDITVLILGESGVGKEVVAREIVHRSNRNKKPFVHINCGAIPENLLESELFGYEGGAFSGAIKGGKVGLFEIANHGTIFLDEVSEMPLALQVKLLSFLQDHTIRRVGSTNSIDLNVRVIAATNRDLESLVEQGLFRHDLYYRLHVVPIVIPALRQRKDDIAPLTHAFLKKFNKKYSINKKIGLQALQVLENYEWPGNVRQLENIIERLVVMAEGGDILPQSIKEYLRIDEPLNQATFTNDIVIPHIMPLKKVVSIIEKELVKRALDTYGTTRAAATALGIAHTSIIRKVAKHKLSNDLPHYRGKGDQANSHWVEYPEGQTFAHGNK